MRAIFLIFSLLFLFSASAQRDCREYLVGDSSTVKVGELDITKLAFDKEIPSKVHFAALEKLKTQGVYFSSVKEAALYYSKTNKFKKRQQITVKTFVLEVLVGKLDNLQTSDHKEGAFKEIRFYSPGKVHSDGVVAVHKIYGDRVVDISETGVIGIKNINGKLNYFEPTSDYVSEYGFELLSDSKVEWRPINESK